VRFLGLNEDPGQYELISDDASPLQGDNLTFTAETIQPYSSNLFYEPIPFEMLKTFETKPQLIVSVDGLPAVCHNLNCDYDFQVQESVIDSFTFDATANSVTFVGQGLPTDDADFVKIKFAHAPCTITAGSSSETGFTCDMEIPPTCGTYIPSVVVQMGEVTMADSVTAEQIDCTITSAVPMSDLNLLGGDNITFTGTNFPHTLSTSTFAISFDNSLTSDCAVQKSSTTELVCLTSAFDSTADSGGSFTPTVVVNDLTIAQSLSFAVRTVFKSGMSVTPASASPVLK